MSEAPISETTAPATTGENPDPAVRQPTKRTAKAAPRKAAAKSPAKSPAKPRASRPKDTAGTSADAATLARGKVGRIPVVDVEPVVQGGLWPAKAVVGEAVPVRATVFREGHDSLAATAVLVAPDGSERSSARMSLLVPGTDRFEAFLTPDATGDWQFRVDAWSDPYASWEHAASIKVPAGIDVDLVLAEGANLLERAAQVPGRPSEDVEHLRGAVAALRDGSRPAPVRLAAATSSSVTAALEALPLRELVSPSTPRHLLVERERALVGSWYEIFPRSIGATYDVETGRWASGTFATAQERLPEIAAMGFDVVYLTPVHPIGTTFRKGPNNTLDAGPQDPGSPYAIGSPDGGHDAINPELGTFDDFDAFVARARQEGLEVALDLALQCSPDHPWVTEHPEWFVHRADGTIAFAENPPKKYQDIYPLDFDQDPEGIYAEVLRVVLLWVEHGVTIFRVDNPHTKPVQFWAWLTVKVREVAPDVLFLSEAFTKPAMMRELAAVGFTQSYTYFTWRTEASELGEYLVEVSSGARDSLSPDGAPDGTAHYLRPSFWPTTHDILTPDMQYGGPAAFALRAIIAATAVPTYGIYSGYELVENVARPGAEEQIDNEKYQFRPRDYAGAIAAGTSLAPLLTSLNRIRREHPSLQRLRGLTLHTADDPYTLAYSRRVPAEHSPTGKDDCVLVVVNLDPHATRETTVHLDVAALGLEPSAPFSARDLLTDETFTWWADAYVKLGPGRSAHVLHVTPLGPPTAAVAGEQPVAP